MVNLNLNLNFYAWIGRKKIETLEKAPRSFAKEEAVHYAFVNGQSNLTPGNKSNT